MERWFDKVAIVTGASSGIGAGIAKLLVNHGLRVVGIARRDEQIKEIGEELKKIGAKGKLFAVKGDLTKEDDIINAVKWTIDNLGGVDILINNAGVFHITSLTGEKGDESKEWRRMLDLNIMGNALMTRECIKYMREKGVDGHIIHIGSVLGTMILDFPGSYMYSGIKHALSVMTEGLRRELRDLGTKIRVTNISPGLTRTNWWETSGFDEKYRDKMYSENASLNVEDVAEAIIFALSRPPHVQIHQLTISPVGESL